MKDPDHLIATLDAALKEYMAGFDTAVKFVNIEQVDMLAEFYLNRRRADLSPDPRIAALVDAATPFYAAVFNDNGDVTISTGHLATADWLKLDAALAAMKGGDV